MDSGNSLVAFFGFIWFLIKEIFTPGLDIPHRIGAICILAVMLCVVFLALAAVAAFVNWVYEALDSWFCAKVNVESKVTHREKRTEKFGFFPFMYSSEECFLAFNMGENEFTFTTDINDFRFLSPGKQIRVVYVIGRISGRAHIKSVVPLKKR
ncbi:MAG TPA: hypothetical protein VJ579_04275 [Candidatus Paceibacterota bacterium]|nr:hypothetical protein [Candidatus Paceibacterota bacterium]